MLTVANLLLDAAMILIAIAVGCYITVIATQHGRLRSISAPAKVLAGAGAGARGADHPAPAEPAAEPAEARSGHGLAWYGAKLVQLALLCLTVSLVARTTVTGHAPFANQHEFAVAFGWGILLAWVWFEARYHIRALALLILPITFVMLLYASNLDAEVAPLVPALQNSLLLTLHVIAAVVAYGAAAVGFGAAVLYLLRPHLRLRGLPSAELLDEIGYRSTVLTFPLLTIMIILGSVWAEIAWGRYWSWDPKETAALVTWLIYGGYLHARVVRDWRGKPAAWLLVIAFIAVLFTFLGNHFFGGLHTYA